MLYPLVAFALSEGSVLGAGAALVGCGVTVGAVGTVTVFGALDTSADGGEAGRGWYGAVGV